jgi:hypothetical protein
VQERRCGNRKLRLERSEQSNVVRSFNVDEIVGVCRHTIYIFQSWFHAWLGLQETNR